MIVINVKKTILIVLFLVTLGGALHLYFNVISPTFVKKPYLEKPSVPEYDSDRLSQTLVINEEHIGYISNELGAYKLHDDPLTNAKPVMEFRVTDIDEVFYVTIDDGASKVSREMPSDPDIIIYGSQAVVLELLNAQDIHSAIAQKAENDEIGVKVLADAKTLTLKGYKTIYDQFVSSDQLTGEVARKLKPAPFTLWTLTLILIYLAVIIEVFFIRK